jgi:dTDP-4-dehydrorhamnose 3,5-epimerase-like enzyme
METKDLFPVIELPEDCRKYQSDIPGLGFEPNYIFHDDDPSLSSETTVYSNTGYIVGHFVTHSTAFAYLTFGIHVGQKDQLTFYSSPPRSLVGYFVDCRRNSSSRRQRLCLKFATSPARKLVIPCGVAHTFSHLETVVTRNDLVLYANANNPTWYPVNDDLVFPWTTEGIDAAPVVDVNTEEIPLAATTLFYRVQQEALRNGQPTVAKKSGKRTAKRKTAESGEIFSLPKFSAELSGCEFKLNSFKSIAEASWMIIPNTPSCVMDFVIIKMDSAKRNYYAIHERQTVLHTFLDREGSEVNVELVDLRADSSTFKVSTRGVFKCDPRFHLRIPAGVLYRYHGTGKYGVRVEYEMFARNRLELNEFVDLGTGRNKFLPRRLKTCSGIRTDGSELSSTSQQQVFCRKIQRLKRARSETTMKRECCSASFCEEG